MKFPHGSVPYCESRRWRLLLKRWVCSSLNHYPRFQTGSWCFGYGYVCDRCHMYADPYPSAVAQQRADALNKLPSEKQQEAARMISRMARNG